MNDQLSKIGHDFKLKSSNINFNNFFLIEKRNQKYSDDN